MFVRDGYRHDIVLAERYLSVSEFPVFYCPSQHVSLSGGKEGVAFRVGIFGDGRVELRIVVYHEIHLGVVDSASVFINHLHVSPGCRSVVVDEIYFGVVRSFEHDFFRSLIVTEHLSMHKKTAACRSVEPSKVQYCLGFAGSEEIPFSVRPCFNPGVVVVGVCPPGSIYLPCRNTDGTQGGDSKSGLFAAPSQRCFYGCERRTCTCVRRLVCHFFVAPMINFKNGFFH